MILCNIILLRIRCPRLTRNMLKSIFLRLCNFCVTTFVIVVMWQIVINSSHDLITFFPLLIVSHEFTNFSYLLSISVLIQLRIYWNLLKPTSLRFYIIPPHQSLNFLCSQIPSWFLLLLASGRPCQHDRQTIHGRMFSAHIMYKMVQPYYLQPKKRKVNPSQQSRWRSVQLCETSLCRSSSLWYATKDNKLIIQGNGIILEG